MNYPPNKGFLGSVDLYDTDLYNEPKQSLLFVKNEDIAQEKRISLSPADFFFEHYSKIIPELQNHMESTYGQDMTRSEKRAEIETKERQNVLQCLIDHELYPIDEYIDGYLELIFAEILGLGLFEPLLNDPTIDEIVVNAHDKVYVEQFGTLKLTQYRFPTVNNCKGKVDKIIQPLSKTLDASHPNVNAQLEDGSRLSASIPPLRARGEISINIRKFKPIVEPLMYYVNKYQSQASEMAAFLEACVKAKLSILVSGGTGSGKTTLLNALSMAIPANERLLTVEDVLELKLQQPHVEPYLTIDKNMEGKGEFTAQMIIREALRKRPDRIIVGECRGGEIVEMLNAMNTGHEGSMSTLHADDARKALDRALTMYVSNPDTSHIPPEVFYKTFFASVDLIVQTVRLDDGSRKIISITETVGIGDEGSSLLKAQGLIKNASDDDKKPYLQDIFRWRQKDMVKIQTDRGEKNHCIGTFETVGYVPKCLEKLRTKGLAGPFTPEFFTKRVLMEVN